MPDYPLTKSRSHESQLGAVRNQENSNSENPPNTKPEHGGGVIKRSRLPTEPCLVDGYNSPLISSPIKSPPYNSAADSDDNSYKRKFNRLKFLGK